MALLELANALTIAPASVTRSDIDGLRDHGFTDEGITTAVEVIAYFNYINRIAEGLGVPLEDWLNERGQPR